jgi:catechol 2,3-dioxygenase-like lactoylglutathione lyase family enzyme
MTRVTGIGGVFFKAKDPDALRAWYRTHLGLAIDDWGGVTFRWHTPSRPEAEGVTVWSIFAMDTKYLDPSPASFMINYRVDDLDRVLAELRAEGCEVDDKVDVSEFGKFGWVMDPERNRIELWEPPPGRFPG